MYANAIPELAGHDFSTTVVATVPVVAERVMYWRQIGSGNPEWIGGTASVGTVYPAQGWVFAEGVAAPGFDTFYLLLNPNPFPITVRGLFMPENGTPVERYYYVHPASRYTVFLNQELGNIGGAAAVFTSADGSYVAERSIYWGAGRVEGSNVMGMGTVANEWHFPEGASGGQFDTYLLLGNIDFQP